MHLLRSGFASGFDLMPSFNWSTSTGKSKVMILMSSTLAVHTFMISLVLPVHAFIVRISKSAEILQAAHCKEPPSNIDSAQAVKLPNSPVSPVARAIKARE
jgi:hypothetical protein